MFVAFNYKLYMGTACSSNNNTNGYIFQKQICHNEVSYIKILKILLVTASKVHCKCMHMILAKLVTTSKVTPYHKHTTSNTCIHL